MKEMKLTIRMKEVENGHNGQTYSKWNELLAKILNLLECGYAIWALNVLICTLNPT